MAYDDHTGILDIKRVCSDVYDHHYIPSLTYGTMVIYQMRFAVGVALISSVFHVIGKLAEALGGLRRW